jgi:hypothetical protein
MEVNEKALFEVIFTHLQASEVLLEDHIRLAQTTTGIYAPRLVDELANVKALRTRMQNLINQAA